MTELNKEQKELLDTFYERGAFTITELPISAFNKLEEINDHETLWHNVAYYLRERLMDLTDHTFDKLTK